MAPLWNAVGTAGRTESFADLTLLWFQGPIGRTEGNAQGEDTTNWTDFSANGPGRKPNCMDTWKLAQQKRILTIRAAGRWMPRVVIAIVEHVPRGDLSAQVVLDGHKGDCQVARRFTSPVVAERLGVLVYVQVLGDCWMHPRA